jgi:hypothetical protein
MRKFSFELFLLGGVLVSAMAIQPREVQAQFDDQTLDHLVWGSTTGNHWGNGMSFVDFNLDGWDDLTTASANGDLHFFAGGPNGFEEVMMGITNPVNSHPKSVIWADMDGDGDRDFLVANRVYFESVFWENQAGTFVNRTADFGWSSSYDWNTFGLCLSDFDLDGDLDVMFSNFHFPTVPDAQGNTLLRNDLNAATPGFTDISQASGIDIGAQPSFQGVWFDYNDDGLPDLYVVHDVAIINSEWELFPNFLMENQGDGTFVDVAPALGLDVATSPMTATAGDPDNDGEIELYCTDVTDTASVLLDKTANGQYVDVAQAWGIECTERWSWGSLWIDYDGDMWEDLLVTTKDWYAVDAYDNYLLHSPGPGLELGQSFTDQTDQWENGNLPKFVAVRGDVNGDGRPDFAALGPSTAAQIMVNTPDPAGPLAHWLTVELCGTESNNEAVGSRMVLHAGGIAQSRYTRAGEDYYAQHSKKAFFGTASILIADSMEVFWPMGSREVFYNLPSDSAYQFIEGAASVELLVSSDPCASDSVWLHLSGGNASFSDSLHVSSGAPSSIESQWFGGLFTKQWAVDWTVYDCDFAPPVVTGCTYEIAGNFNADAVEDDGSCNFESLCGPGTIWSVLDAFCVPVPASCAEDLNGDGIVGIDDVLSILSAYGSFCD